MNGEQVKPTCRYCGVEMIRRQGLEMVDEERYAKTAWYECPDCGSRSPVCWADKALQAAVEMQPVRDKV